MGLVDEDDKRNGGGDGNKGLHCSPHRPPPEVHSSTVLVTVRGATTFGSEGMWEREGGGGDGEVEQLNRPRIHICFLNRTRR